MLGCKVLLLQSLLRVKGKIMALAFRWKQSFWVAEIPDIAEFTTVYHLMV